MDEINCLREFEQLIDKSPRLGWDSWHMLHALITKLRSPSDRLKVGCVCVRDRRIISTGYNGFLPGAEHTPMMRNGHEQNTVHAEQNMVADCASRGVSIRGAIAYVTHYPCINCTKMLTASHITEVKYWKDYRNDPIAAKMFEEAGITVTKMCPGDDEPDDNEDVTTVE